MHCRDVEANGIRFRIHESGEGALVLLLHGFPDLGIGWRHQIRSLAAAGMHAVAPDLRGYGGSDRPSQTGAYRMAALVADVVGLARALGGGRAALVGHDWGGVVAWYAAMHHPDVFERLVILNAPHPVRYAQEVRRPSSGQAMRSWYARFFQLRWLPERLLAARDLAQLRRVWRDGPARDPQILRQYVESFTAPGALTPPLRYYREAFRRPRPAVRTVSVPTLVLWGDRDRFLVPSLADGLEPWVEDVRVIRVPGAGHWLHHDEPERIDRALVSFLAGR
jgi:epoxide hydrolase 4